MDDEAPPFRWLIHGVVAGGPHPERHSRLEMAVLHSTFDAVLTLFEERLGPRLLEPWGPRLLRWLKTREGEAPNLVEACAFLRQARDAGVATLVHCWEGLGRTGTVLGAWLIDSGEATGADEACRLVRERYHPRAIETPAQMAGLEAFAKKRR